MFRAQSRGSIPELDTQGENQEPFPMQTTCSIYSMPSGVLNQSYQMITVKREVCGCPLQFGEFKLTTLTIWVEDCQALRDHRYRYLGQVLLADAE